MASHFGKLAPDVILIQETHMQDDSKLILNPRKYPTQFHAAGTSKSKGVSILLKNGISFCLKDRMQDDKGRFLFVKGELEGEMVTLASVYAPNDNQIMFLQNVFQKLVTFLESRVYVAEDFNYITELSKDRTYKGMNPQFQTNQFTKLHELTEQFQLVDVWRHKNPWTRDYTYYSSRHQIHTRIDFILTTKQDIHKINTANIG